MALPDINVFLGKRPRDEHFEKNGLCVKTVRSRQEVDDAAMHMIREAHKDPDPDAKRLRIVKVQKWAEEQKVALSAAEKLNSEKKRASEQASKQ